MGGSVGEYIWSLTERELGKLALTKSERNQLGCSLACGGTPSKASEWKNIADQLGTGRAWQAVYYLAVHGGFPQSDALLQPKDDLEKTDAKQTGNVDHAAAIAEDEKCRAAKALEARELKQRTAQIAAIDRALSKLAPKTKYHKVVKTDGHAKIKFQDGRGGKNQGWTVKHAEQFEDQRENYRLASKDARKYFECGTDLEKRQLKDNRVSVSWDDRGAASEKEDGLRAGAVFHLPNYGRAGAGRGGTRLPPGFSGVRTNHGAGDCMFLAILHYLRRPETSTAAQLLRTGLGNHRRGNTTSAQYQDDHKSLVAMGDHGYTKGDRQRNQGCTPEECVRSYYNRMRNLRQEGGELELRDLARMLHRPIHIHVLDKESKKWNRRLHILLQRLSNNLKQR